MLAKTVYAIKCLKTLCLTILSITSICQSSLAQRTELTDSLTKKNTFWTSKPVKISVVPVLLIAGSAATWGIRKDVRSFRNRYLPTFRYHYDDYLQYAPVAVVLGLNAAGVKGKNKMGRALVSYAFSAVFMASVVNAVKYTAKVQRPDGSSKNPFPSGHTANSFMNATFLHKEYGQYRSPLYSIGAYTAATATAVGRELNNRHWISDVLAGLKAYVNYFNSKNDFKLGIIDDISPNGSYTFKDYASEKVRFDNLAVGLGLTAYLW